MTITKKVFVGFKDERQLSLIKKIVNHYADVNKEEL